MSIRENCEAKCSISLFIPSLGDKPSWFSQQKTDAVGIRPTINFPSTTRHNFSKRSGTSDSPDLSDLQILQSLELLQTPILQHYPVGLSSRFVASSGTANTTKRVPKAYSIQDEY
jgi:hypothetical protein